MARVTAHQDILGSRTEKKFPTGQSYFETIFIKQLEGDTPWAFFAESSPGRVLRTHYHAVDEFQVVYKGRGALGSRPLSFGDVHFARAYTPYGPLDYQDDLGFFTLRPRRDKGARHMPEAAEELKAMPERRPWQTSGRADFDLQPGPNGIAAKAIEGMKDEHGLAAFSMVMKPGAAAYSLDPSKGDGQYILVMKGGINHAGDHKKAPTVIWVERSEPAFRLEAGPEGAAVLVLNFPERGSEGAPAATVPAAPRRDDFKTYQCLLCAFVYDEAEGHPDAGIAPGTRWADVPDAFTCPDCGAAKADFEMIEF